MATPNAQALRSLDSYPPERLPESDGKPMAETDIHRDQMVDLIYGLREFLRPDSRRDVSGNLFVYYRDETGERQSVARQAAEVELNRLREELAKLRVQSP